ncbi:VOC family protein [Xanthobacteraceae bacterium A53D]
MADTPATLQGPTLDHVVVNVMDQLDPALATYEKLGFKLTPRGHHSLGSANNLAIFGTDYLELLGFEAGKNTSRPDLWKHPPGLTGLVFKPGDPDARYADLKARGVPVDPPAEFTRPVDLPGGAKDAHFRVLRIAADEVQNGRTFFCHHYTPELVWQPEMQSHPNGTTAVAEFVIASVDPARTAAIYERMFGPGLLTQVDGGVTFPAGAATVSVLTPEAIARKFSLVPELGPNGTDHMVALVYATADIAQAKAVLEASGVPFAPYGAGLVVAPEHAAGVITGFVPAA